MCELFSWLNVCMRTRKRICCRKRQQFKRPRGAVFGSSSSGPGEHELHAHVDALLHLSHFVLQPQLRIRLKKCMALHAQCLCQAVLQYLSAWLQQQGSDAAAAPPAFVSALATKAYYVSQNIISDCSAQDFRQHNCAAVYNLSLAVSYLSVVALPARQQLQAAEAGNTNSSSKGSPPKQQQQNRAQRANRGASVTATSTAAAEAWRAVCAQKQQQAGGDSYTQLIQALEIDSRLVTLVASLIKGTYDSHDLLLAAERHLECTAATSAMLQDEDAWEGLSASARRNWLTNQHVLCLLLPPVLLRAAACCAPEYAELLQHKAAQAAVAGADLLEEPGVVWALNKFKQWVAAAVGGGEQQGLPVAKADVADDLLWDAAAVRDLLAEYHQGMTNLQQQLVNSFRSAAGSAADLRKAWEGEKEATYAVTWEVLSRLAWSCTDAPDLDFSTGLDSSSGNGGGSGSSWGWGRWMNSTLAGLLGRNSPAQELQAEVPAHEAVATVSLLPIWHQHTGAITSSLEGLIRLQGMYPQVLSPEVLYVPELLAKWVCSARVVAHNREKGAKTYPLLYAAVHRGPEQEAANSQQQLHQQQQLVSLLFSALKAADAVAAAGSEAGGSKAASNAGLVLVVAFASRALMLQHVHQSGMTSAAAAAAAAAVAATAPTAASAESATAAHDVAAAKAGVTGVLLPCWVLFGRCCLHWAAVLLSRCCAPAGSNSSSSEGTAAAAAAEAPAGTCSTKSQKVPVLLKKTPDLLKSFKEAYRQLCKLCCQQLQSMAGDTISPDSGTSSDGSGRSGGSRESSATYGDGGVLQQLIAGPSPGALLQQLQGTAASLEAAWPGLVKVQKRRSVAALDSSDSQQVQQLVRGQYEVRGGCKAALEAANGGMQGAGSNRGWRAVRGLSAATLLSRWK